MTNPSPFTRPSARACPRCGHPTRYAMPTRTGDATDLYCTACDWTFDLVLEETKAQTKRAQGRVYGNARSKDIQRRQPQLPGQDVEPLTIRRRRQVRHV